MTAWEDAMKLSFSTNAFTNFSVFRAVEAIADTGYSGIELLADSPHLYPFATTDSDLARLESLLQAKGLEVANINANTAVGFYSHGPDGKTFWEPLFEPSLANPDKDARNWRIAYTRKCIDMARFLSCPTISVTSGRAVPGSSPDTARMRLRESLDGILDYAAGKGVRVGMEYEPGLLVENCAELSALIEATGAENFGANLDLGHSHVLGERPEDVIAAFSSRIFHIHLEDIRARKHYHLIPGEGDMDFNLIFRCLAGISYAGFVTVELYTYPDNPGYAAEKALHHLKNLKPDRMEL